MVAKSLLGNQSSFQQHFSDIQLSINEYKQHETKSAVPAEWRGCQMHKCWTNEASLYLLVATILH